MFDFVDDAFEDTSVQALASLVSLAGEVLFPAAW
jgi:hypothetical protein